MPLTQKEKDELFRYCFAKMSFASMLVVGSSNSKKAEGGNIALLEVWNGTDVVLSKSSFSSSSSMPKLVKEVLAPSVGKASLGHVGIPNGSQHANHTEPKLFEYFKGAHGSIGPFTRVILASQMRCCASCLKNTIREMNGLNNLLSFAGGGFEFIVVEIEPGTVREGDELI